MKYSVLLLFLLLAGSNLWSAEVSGRVLDHLGRGLSGATVTVAGGEQTTTDADGWFQLTAAASIDPLAVTAPGFVNRNFTLGTGPYLERLLTLYPSGIAIPSSVTVSTRQAQRLHRVAQQRSQGEHYNWLGGRPAEQYSRYSGTRDEMHSYTEVVLDNGLVEVVVAPS